MSDLKVKVRKLLDNTLVLVVIVLAVGASIGYAMRSGDDGDGKSTRVVAVASCDKQVVRVGEPITFCSDECQGEIGSYCWQFGDGSSSNESDPVKAYDAPGWYNVTLILTNCEGMYTNDTVCVGVQPEDLEVRDTLSANWEMRVRYIEHNWLQDTYIAPNIHHPRTEIVCSLENAVGTFEFEVVFWVWSEGWAWGETLQQESFVATGGQLVFEHVVEPEDLDETVTGEECSLELLLTIREGLYTSGEVSMVAEYPVEGLQAPGG